MLRRYTYKVARWVETTVEVLGIDDDDAWEKASRQADSIPISDYEKGDQPELDLIRDEAIEDADGFYL